ncbi:MAG: hypothetical protein QM689_01675 [Oscillospiraceae bacterium]
MAELKFRDINPTVIEQLDRIVKNENYDSRNQLVNEILTLYVASRNEFFLKALPPTVHSLCTNLITDQNEALEKTLDALIPIYRKLLDRMDELISLFRMDTEIE